jgi:hypothetical protein
VQFLKFSRGIPPDPVKRSSGRVLGKGDRGIGGNWEGKGDKGGEEVIREGREKSKEREGLEFGKEEEAGWGENWGEKGTREAKGEEGREKERRGICNPHFSDHDSHLSSSHDLIYEHFMEILMELFWMPIYIRTMDGITRSTWGVDYTEKNSRGALVVQANGGGKEEREVPCCSDSKWTKTTRGILLSWKLCRDPAGGVR